MSRSRAPIRPKLCACALLCALLVTSAARAEGPETGRSGVERVGAQTWDLVVLRPLGLVQTVVGAAFFAVAYPVSLVTGGSDHVVDYCIKSPVEQTFTRPLGEL